MKTVSVIVGYVTERMMLRGLVQQIHRYAHQDIATEIIVVNQSANDDLDDVAGIVNVPSPQISAGAAIDVGLTRANGEYVCTLDADAFPIHPGWLYVPIMLIERHGFAYVGSSTGMEESYARLGPFLHLNNYYRVSRRDTAVACSEAAGFRRRSDADNGVYAMHYACTSRMGPLLSMPITHAIAHTPKLGIYGMVIEDLVFHLVFGFAEEWIGDLEGHIGLDYLRLRDRLFCDGLTDENLALIEKSLQPVPDFPYKHWTHGGELVRLNAATADLVAEIALLKSEAQMGVRSTHG